jgi:hypothetical protein
MEKLIVIASWLVTEGPSILSALIGVLTAMIGLAMLIPGEQPEKALKKAVEFLSKYSRK